MTPMQKLKSQFDEFKVYLGTSFKEIVLNKSEHKEYYSNFCGEITEHINKGVKSDFVRLYRLQYNKEDTTTLGFSFSYLDLEEKDYKVSFTLSVGKDIKVFSKKLEMTIEECKTHLNSINTILKVSENSSNEEIVEVVKEEFLGPDYSLKVQSKKKKIK